MKRILSLLVITTFFFSSFTIYAQEETVVQGEAVQEEVMVEELMVEEPEERSFTQELKNRFIDGCPGFMGIVLACLIFGLAIAIERIIYFNLATTNTQ